MKKLLLAACLAACALAQQPSAAPVLEGKTLRPANSDDLRMLGILSSSARQAAQKTGRHNPEMEKLSAAAFAAYGKQDFTASFRYVTRYLFGLQGTPVSEATEIATAYDLKLDRKILTPGAALRISLVPLFTLDRPLAGKYTVGLSIRSAEGNKVRPLDEQELTDMRNVEVTFKDKLAPGSYTVHYELRTAGGALVLEESRAFLADDAAGQRLARLRGAFDALPPAKSPGQAAASESIEYILTLLERATREYAGDAAGVAHPLANRFRKTLSPIRAPSEPFHLHRDLDLAEALAADLRHGRKPFAARTGDLRLAYRSSIDNTLQPFRLFVPAGYAPSKNWPLIVALHGAGGDENAYFDRYLNPANGENLFKQLAQERGYLGVAPNGRGQYGMYVANSEKDVLEVIDRVLAVFRVDPKQVYLTGHSMGGMGTFGVGFRHAGRFQALAPVAGAGNLAGLPLDNAPDMPVLFSQGAKDTIVTPESSRAAAAIARKKLANFDYREHPDDDHFIIGVTSMRDVFDFFDARRKRAAGNGQ